MKNAKLIINKVIDEIWEQAENGRRWNDIGCLIVLDTNNEYGILVLTYLTSTYKEDSNFGYRYGIEVSLRTKFGAIYDLGEIEHSCYADSKTHEKTLGKLPSLIMEVIDYYDHTKGDVIERETFKVVNYYDGVNLEEMEENFYQGYQG